MLAATPPDYSAFRYLRLMTLSHFQLPTARAVRRCGRVPQIFCAASDAIFAAIRRRHRRAIAEIADISCHFADGISSSSARIPPPACRRRWPPHFAAFTPLYEPIAFTPPLPLRQIEPAAATAMLRYAAAHAPMPVISPDNSSSPASMRSLMSAALFLRAPDFRLAAFLRFRVSPPRFQRERLSHIAD